jgi:hypothetical protein
VNLPQIDLGKVTTLGTLLLLPLLILAGLAGVTVAAGGPPWFLIGVFVMLVVDFGVVLGAVALSVTRRHPHFLLSTPEVLIRLYQRGLGDDFQRDTKQLRSGELVRPEPGSLEYQRKEIYESNRGSFLVHTWRPSSEQGQVADIVIRLAEHLDTRNRPSLLQEGEIKSVTYELGRKFSSDPFEKTNAADNFRLKVSAWGPMLCLAEVAFNDGTEPVRLTRYIDFPTEEEMREAGLL